MPMPVSTTERESLSTLMSTGSSGLLYLIALLMRFRMMMRNKRASTDRVALPCICISRCGYISAMLSTTHSSAMSVSCLWYRSDCICARSVSDSMISLILSRCFWRYLISGAMKWVSSLLDDSCFFSRRSSRDPIAMSGVLSSCERLLTNCLCS